jgi:hypothetical protein
VAITVWELAKSQPLSRTVDSASAVLKYVVMGSTVATDVYAAVAAYAPATYSGYRRQEITTDPQGAGIWTAEVRFGFSATGNDTPVAPPTPTDGDALGPEYSVDITAGQVHITQSLATPRRWQGSDQISAGTALSVDASNNLKVNPNGWAVGGGDVGKKLIISAGPGWTQGVYTISAAGGGNWTLGTSPGAVGLTGGQWVLVTSETAVGTARDFENAIGATADRIEGTDIFVPHFEFTVKKQEYPFNLPLMRLIRRLAGTVNHAPWRLFEAGEVLYLGASGLCGPDNIWTLTHKFAVGENLYAVRVSDAITVPFKGAWEYLWCAYSSQTAVDGLVQVPSAAYVETVYRKSDFTLLGLGT